MIVVGVDTHQRTHHAVVLDHTGKRLADREIPVTERGYAALLDWASGFGLIDRFDVNPTGVATVPDSPGSWLQQGSGSSRSTTPIW